MAGAFTNQLNLNYEKFYKFCVRSEADSNCRKRSYRPVPNHSTT